ncbi:protein kinase domain-containing protein [Parendozoicomonas haliclonae]|uniref:Serine/threonine-protein kinase PrkC n=1 Tax=Parendozoicomonas haliclonae TaxID=1960125 RepID=A0A1X7AJY3_9GAMM|nr:protein kinase [Parendozoicomonas haliclonae]SMA42651.1 Serine/threonine-protein kinase PrkC [Parendozoicomonas haliclonae]
MSVTKHYKGRKTLKNLLPSSLTNWVYKKQVGEGEFGVVHKYSFGRRCKRSERVFKVFTDSASRANRKNELCQARMVQKLSHPNIVQVIEVCDQEDKCQGVVMECMNTDLFALMEITAKWECPLSFCLGREVLNEVTFPDYCRQILMGLAYLHQNRIVHCDVKPENILISGGVAKIADFGLAVKLGWLQLAVQSSGGTPGFTPPESHDRAARLPQYGFIQTLMGGGPTGSVSRKFDIFSFGCILLDVYTGEPLHLGKFIGKDFGFFGHLYQNPAALRDCVTARLKQAKTGRAIPDGHAEVMYQALAYHPSKRPDAATLREKYFSR